MTDLTPRPIVLDHPPVEDCPECRHCGRPIFLDTKDKWIHRIPSHLSDAPVQLTFGARGCRSASYSFNNEEFWDDSISYSANAAAKPGVRKSDAPKAKGELAAIGLIAQWGITASMATA